MTGVGGTLVLDTSYVKDLLGGSAPTRLTLAWEGEYKAIAVRDADRRPGEITADDAWVLMPQYGREVHARFERACREAAAGERPRAA